MGKDKSDLVGEVIYRIWTIGFLLVVWAALASVVAKLVRKVPWSALWALTEKWWGTAVAVLAATAGAFALFELRKRRRRMYAVLEFMVAQVTIALAVTSQSPTPERGIKLAAGIYLIVRAIDNYRQGSPAKPAALAPTGAAP